MRRIHLTLAVALVGSACWAQSGRPGVTTVAAQEPAAGSHGRASVSSGQKTVVGCVAIGSPSGYVLRTDDGNTINLRGIGNDLSAYVGKKVQINATWNETGVVMTSPLEPAGGDTAAAAGGKPATDFAGDIHLRLKGRVLGDCLGKK